jgi:hypothetical protein
MALFDEGVDEMAAYESGAASYKRFHGGGILYVVYFPFDKRRACMKRNIL